ncbi:hypothetical protein Tco_1269079, partial [Tanacetum coccineum]
VVGKKRLGDVVEKFGHVGIVVEVAIVEMQLEKPSKASNAPLSSFSCGSAKNGGLQYHSSASNIHTSNPYDALDDMESDEEVEVLSCWCVFSRFPYE